MQPCARLTKWLHTERAHGEIVQLGMNDAKAVMRGFMVEGREGSRLSLSDLFPIRCKCCQQWLLCIKIRQTSAEVSSTTLCDESVTAQEAGPPSGGHCWDTSRDLA